MNAVYEFEGYQLIENGKPTGEIIPAYNAILEDYNPDIAHLGKLAPMTGKSILTKKSEVIELQKTLYLNFFHIESVFRNLRINNLIDKKQLSRLRVHYNFLSKYVHLSMDNIKIWKETVEVGNQRNYDDETYNNLIFLYVAKLFHLYLQVYVVGYENNENLATCNKYKKIIEQLNSLSKDLWFFDNEPAEYDIKNSQYLKSIGRFPNGENSADLIYYDNPLERMKLLISYEKQDK